MLITAIGVPMGENILNFIGNQKLWWYVLNFISILFMLKIDVCFISGTLSAKICNLSSVRLDILS